MFGLSSPLTRSVLLVLLQDSDPLVLAVVGDRGAAVPAGAVVVHHPAALPLQRGEAGPGGRDTGPGARDTEPGARDTEPGARDTGPGARDTEPGARDTEPGARDTEPGARQTEPGGPGSGQTQQPQSGHSHPGSGPVIRPDGSLSRTAPAADKVDKTNHTGSG